LRQAQLGWRKDSCVYDKNRTLQRISILQEKQVRVILKADDQYAVMPSVFAMRYFTNAYCLESDIEHNIQWASSRIEQQNSSFDKTKSAVDEYAEACSSGRVFSWAEGHYTKKLFSCGIPLSIMPFALQLDPYYFKRKRRRAKRQFHYEEEIYAGI